MTHYHFTNRRAYERLGLDRQVVAERGRRAHAAALGGHPIQLAPVRRVRASLWTRICDAVRARVVA